MNEFERATLALEQEASEKIKRDYELIVVEMQKVSLLPTDSLMVTIKRDYLEPAEIKPLAEKLKDAFPNNKVFLFHVASDEDIKFAVVTQMDKEYSNECKCGKKALKEGN